MSHLSARSLSGDTNPVNVLHKMIERMSASHRRDGRRANGCGGDDEDDGRGAQPPRENLTPADRAVHLLC